MAVSTFRSSTRRGGNGNGNGNESRGALATSSTSAGRDPLSEKKPALLRRSRSVSAFSRSSEVLDFSIKRDNPLFCSGESSPAKGSEAVSAPKKLSADVDCGKVDSSRIGGAKSGVGNHRGSCSGDDKRGRTASRNSSNSSGIGWSVSRGRTRSVSQRPISRRHVISSESEVEQETSPIKNYRNSSSVNLMRSSIESVDPGQVKTLCKWSSQHPASESSGGSASRSHVEFPKWIDGERLCMDSLAEVEEKTINAVYEQIKSLRGHQLGEQTMSTGIYQTVRSEVRQAISDIQNDLENAIRRNNTAAIRSSDIVDITPDLVRPGASELVMDMRSEYTKKLEQSQERARKLRAELAVEEHRGEELRRILKELLPDPIASNSQKHCPARGASAERRKMSRRLKEEALAYFDECVSLSTFDSSDFSSPEDLPLKTICNTGPDASETKSMLRAHSTMSSACDVSSLCYDNQDMREGDHIKSVPEHPTLRAADPHCQNSEPGSSSSTNVESRGSKFSFSGMRSSYTDLQQDIRKYMKSIKTNPTKDDDVHGSSRTSSQYDYGAYNIQTTVQTRLFDRLMHKNQVESGSLLLCGGGIDAVMFSTFGSIV
ncbi:hypothetical protein SAY87_006109 [Trapa incisa]|uniref:Uncharacterized protein n=1 Tax=Trapa incisa TaxID=236973 RepID=A0AAN7K700_9MYRT|nr:hypothetical protein SAY87_006109 [Trapa incisa]